MRRARQHPLIVLALVLAGAALAPASAHAYHTGKLFDRASGGGGAGGLFYTGSRRDRGWDCTACHVDPPGRLRVDVSSQPPELLSQHVYTPGTTYTIVVTVVDPSAQLGIPATRSNFNGIAISMLDADGAPAGVIGGFDSGRFHTHGPAVLASDTFTVDETSWKLSWTAPTDAAGPIAIDLGVVDGNGAGQAGTTTLTDPIGDDVVMLHYVVADGGGRAERVRPRGQTIRGTSPSDTRPAAALRCRRCRRRARPRGSRRPSRDSRRCR